jgi:hypothetical protein
MTKCIELHKGVYNSHIELYENKKTLIIGNVVVNTSEPVLIGNKTDGHWVNLFRLLPLVGGACELLPKQDQLRICLRNKEFLINCASSFVNRKNGFVKISIINTLASILGGSDTSIEFKVR